ncbi:MAG: SsrA-binding protein [Candidatus Shikimatogenerans bostrichidophilus]|nr:MAG: SsrA-binding protein [Candidatus Shikimatogenerans bostrichidophilus]
MKKKNIINKKAYYDYYLIEKFNAGMILFGEEVKLIRQNKFNIYLSYCKIKNNEIYIYNFKIHNKKIRNIKLLLLKKEINKINKKIKNNNLTIIPTKIFYSYSGFIKLEIFISKRKKIYDIKKIIKKKDKKKNKDYNNF